jgi:hypothetical protein
MACEPELIQAAGNESARATKKCNQFRKRQWKHVIFVE